MATTSERHLLDVTAIAALSDHIDLCPNCGGSGVDDHWVVEDQPATLPCGRCGGSGCAAPTAKRVRELYRAHAEQLDPDQRALLVHAVRLLVHIEDPEQPAPRRWPAGA